MPRCPDCAAKGFNIELPEQESYEFHRQHADPVFILARAAGWEDSFMVDYDSPPDAVDVRDAECARVCIAPSVAAAQVIKAALDEYWARHNL